ncbi:MAG TPA: hypothetical protein VFY48_11725 [Solirubrobacterales bacterium]|nr:hypothetical protein [Solirubrobacterales bacterium]
MGVLNQRVARPAEIAMELGVETNCLMYHVRKLVELGLIELVKVEKTDGGRILGHYYRATARPWVEAEEWKQIDPKDQVAVTAMILANCNADMRSAVSAGTIHGEDNVIARIPIAVDSAGDKELVDLLNETTHKVLDIAERSAARAGTDTGELTPFKVHLLHFESPGPRPLNAGIADQQGDL